MLPRSPRAVALWLAALVVALGTAALVASDLAALHRHATSLGPERPALVATRDLALGSVVADDDLRARTVHRSQVPPGVLRRTTDAVGRVVTVPVVRGGFVATANLAPRRREGLDGALPTGTRAMRVVVTDAVRPRPGAAVDVYATFEQSIGPDDAAAGSPATVIAAGVSVLATDATRRSESRDTFGVTLLVSPRQARALAFAASHGIITLALVPPEEARAP